MFRVFLVAAADGPNVGLKLGLHRLVWKNDAVVWDIPKWFEAAKQIDVNAKKISFQENLCPNKKQKKDCFSEYFGQLACAAWLHFQNIQLNMVLEALNAHSHME